MHRINTGVLLMRRYSQKNDAIHLADALGLLSPRRNVKPPPKKLTTQPYRPLIFTNLSKGPVAEHYNEIKKDLLADYKIPMVDHSRQMDTLLKDLRAVNEISHRNVLQKNLYNHVKTLQNEDELIELTNLSFYQNRLTMPLFTRFIMNKNLTDLSRLPFNVQNIDKVVLARNGWTDVNFAELKVLLMKKYHDLNKPLLIVKLLKDNFDSEFLPFIRLRQFSPFYERIVWKFYFDYISQNEAEYIKSLDNVRSSFMIWEASSAKCSEIAQVMLAHHEPSGLQQLFLQLCSSNAVEKVVKSDLSEGRSLLLSSLKKTSVKFKIYDIKTTATESVANRALRYSLIHAIENVVNGHFGNWHQDVQLAAIMDQLKHCRTDMVHQGVPQPDTENMGVFTN